MVLSSVTRSVVWGPGREAGFRHRRGGGNQTAAPGRTETVTGAAAPPAMDAGSYSMRPMKFVRSSQSGSVVALHGGAPKPAGTLG